MKSNFSLIFIPALALLLGSVPVHGQQGRQAVAAGNAQQPAPLPADPLPGDRQLPGAPPEVPLLPEEMPLRMDELPLSALPEDKPTEQPRIKLQLAIEAMQPVLPPLNDGLMGNSLAGAVKIVVKRFTFTGNRVFSSGQLAKLLLPYTGREITSEELEEARMTLTRHYVDAGYISSGALLPDQDVASGVIQFQIVEGRLAEIELHGNFWFRSWWLRNELRRAAGRPVNFNRLKVGLQLLRQNPTISRINAELKPGVKPGESILDVGVKDEQPFRFGIEVSNKRPPSVAEGLGEIYFTDLNVTGHSDVLDLRWGLARWTKDGAVDYAEFDNISGSYEFPITPWDTTLGIHASKSDSSIIDETFAALGITSKSKEVGVTLKQPVFQTLNNTVNISLSADRKQSETFLLGRPFTLSLGALDGETDVFATRLGLEWVNRSQVQVLALRSIFSLGLYDFGSTRADPRNASSASSGAGNKARGFDPEIPDSKFFSWLGQAQYVRRIFDLEAFRQKPDTVTWNTLRETLLILRANAQISDEPLLSLEQFSIGGAQSVRGYRENQLLRDDGVFASAEFHVPLWLAKDKTPIISLAPFFDFAAGWNINKVDDNYETIYSAGVGLLVNATKHVQASLYWGHPFVDLHETKESLQDYGIHFSISVNAF